MPLPSPRSRRGWATSFALCLLLSLLPFAAARAQVQCAEEDGRGWSHCRAFLAEPLTQRMLRSQERPRWCWAAALSMVFARYGYELPQEEIVERIYGARADVGIPTQQLLAVIDREWSGNGQVLRVSTRHQAAGADATIPASATLLVSSLARGRPLILSAQGHAVVVVGITYQERGSWLRITGGMVVDPRPGVGLRPLRLEELDVSLLASVEVMARPDFVSVVELGRAGAAR